MTVNFEDIGYRGLAVKKTEGLFSMYLLDFGGSLVNVAPGQLRPLPPSLNNPLAVMYEVCLVGMGPIEGEVWGEEGWQLDLGIDLSGEIWMETKADGGEWVLVMILVMLMISLQASLTITMPPPEPHCLRVQM